MQALTSTDAIWVTGSSGFIGSHLCRSLGAGSNVVCGVDRAAPAQNGYCDLRADIQDLPQLQLAVPAGVGGVRLVHLAAEAEVVTPWCQVPSMFTTNLNGTWNVLSALRPSLCVFASSSSIYGNASLSTSVPTWRASRPLSLYGISKSSCELLLRDWAAENSTSAILFRLGNVIGPACRGLIPYLVRHAQRYPDGDTEAELRGEGRLVRDYTPVSFVVNVIEASLERRWKAGSTHVFNIGTERGMTNRDVTAIVQHVLEKEGYRLRANWNNPIPMGESRKVVLDCAALVKTFGVPLPSREEVEHSIEKSVRYHLGREHA